MHKLGHSSAYERGRQDMLRKLGASKTHVQGPATNTEVSQPLDSQDENVPAGQLAGALSQMETPVSRDASTSQDDTGVEGRLNRSTQWGSPDTIPLEFTQGSSTIIPGAF